jgi:hypothetical protein
VKAGAITLALVVALPGAVQAQRDQLIPQFTLEILKPPFDNTGLLNSTLWLGYDTKLSDTVMFNIHLPISIFDPDISGAGGEVGVGNPYIGILRGLSISSLFQSIGVALPTTSEANANALWVGRVADWSRFWFYVPDWLTIESVFHYWPSSRPNWYSFAGAGIAIMIPTSGGQETEVFFPFYSGVSRRISDTTISVGIDGRFYLTAGKHADLEDSFSYQAILGAEFTLGPVRPGIKLGFPLDTRWKNSMDGRVIIGMYLKVPSE